MGNSTNTIGINSDDLIAEDIEDNKKLLEKHDKCDKYDYLVAVGCGAIGGLIDIFLVGAPGDSVLGKLTDKQIDNVVKNFSKMMGWNPRAGKENSIASAIGFLEKKFGINYDQRHSADVNGLFDMSTKNHHMKSLAHSPDIIGLFFSVLNQFTSTATFVTDGQLVTIDTETFELYGGNFISKIFCGIANWFGHIMSDVAGSSGARGNGSRGSGIVIPFYELLGLCKFGKFSVGKDRQDLATIATRAFQEGYDFRFGLAMAIPVLITELLIRLIWSFRRFFQYRYPLRDCIPTQRHDDLRIMLLVGNGTLCVMDAIDAGVRSGGNFLMFFMRINFIAWLKLIKMVIKEICIRIGFSADLSVQIDAMRKIDEAVSNYLTELEKIDYERFVIESKSYEDFANGLVAIKDDYQMSEYLLETYKTMDLELPWKGDFDEFMSDKNNNLVFD